uniref:Uncharacterized protein n=1 Tax=Cannabis sativa TaxID=3483 RepID=A0A803QWS8_CANSA
MSLNQKPHQQHKTFDDELGEKPLIARREYNMENAVLVENKGPLVVHNIVTLTTSNQRLHVILQPPMTPLFHFPQTTS